MASLAAVLKDKGHEFRLFDCTKYRLSQTSHDWNLVGESNLQFKVPGNAGRLPHRIPITYRGILDELVKAIDEFKPDVIGLSALTDDYPLGLGMMREAKKAFPTIPTIAGGVHATVDPLGVISESCFDMVCVGEGEHAVLDLAERVDAGTGFSGVANLWVKNSDGIERNRVRPYETDLGSFPMPDWSIYADVAFYKPFQGHVYKYGDFEMSRGCPYKCSYCINVHLQEIYAGYQFHREKSIPRVIEEIKLAIDQYQIEFLKFWDETFLLMSRSRLEEFGDLYSSEIGLPYVIETTAESIDEVSASVLRKTNCRSASLGMETGSPNMRKGLLHKPTGNAVYVKAFKLLGEYGVQKVSFNMIGLPTEGQQDIFRTIGLNRLVRTEVQSVGIFYPYKGTPIRDMMVREGWMAEDFDLSDLQDYNFNTFTSENRSVVRFKDMNSRILNNLRTLLGTYVLWPVVLYPLIDHVKNEQDDFSRELFRNIFRVSYFKKYREWPPSTPEGATASPSNTSRHGGPLSSAIRLDDPEAADFAALLMDSWRGDHFDHLCAMLDAIAKGTLTPEFAIPTNEAALLEWLDIELDEAELKQTRSQLRQIAKANSAGYVGKPVAPLQAERTSGQL